MDKKILMIDDIKECIHIVKDPYADFSEKYYQENEVHVVRTYNEGIEELKKKTFDTLLLDHDLGGIKTGYDILCWLEINTEFIPENIMLISNNPVGIKNMAAVLNKFLLEGKIKQWNWGR